MTVIIDQPEVVFVEIWDATNVIAALTPDPSMIEIITATAPVTVETVPATHYLEVVEDALRGPQGPQGPPGGTSVDGWWDYSAFTTPPPAAGEIRTAPAVVVLAQPMTIYLSATDDDGLIWQGSGLMPGDQLRLRGSQGAVQTCTVTAYALTVPGPDGYATISGTVSSLSGQIARNARVEVTLVRAASGELVVTFPTGAEPPLANIPDGTLWVEYTP